MPKVSEDHLAARRRQILDGARRCFAEYGYDKATVRRLEQAIGMSRGAIFHHFRDKDALFFTLAHEDAERMADVASREGLIQVMRDMLAAPEQFDWLATRLEIARKLRNDPEFSRGWAERSAELAAATTDRLRRQKRRSGCATTFPATCCSAIWTWCSTAWWPGWHQAKIRGGCPPCSTWWRNRCAATTLGMPGAPGAPPARERDRTATNGHDVAVTLRSRGPGRVIGAAPAAHRGT